MRREIGNWILTSRLDYVGSGRQQMIPTRNGQIQVQFRRASSGETGRYIFIFAGDFQPSRWTTRVGHSPGLLRDRNQGHIPFAVYDAAVCLLARARENFLRRRGEGLILDSPVGFVPLPPSLQLIVR